ncbi:DUF4351 domain-containing protein [Leptolyngbyaceae cyanobacterium UHCC 1019]
MAVIFASLATRSRLLSLPLPILEDLSEALLNFTTLADLEAWLEAHSMTENDRP